jgi:hypothetical protein
MVGIQWEYVSKSEWKQITRKVVKIEEPIKGGDAISATVEEKRLKHKKQKSK